MEKASEGDLLFLGKRQDETILFVFAEKDSRVEAQLKWLFGFPENPDDFVVIDKMRGIQWRKKGFVEKKLLEKLGIGKQETDPSFLESIFRTFPETKRGKYPSTKDFSDFSRKTLNENFSLENADEAIVSWMEREELLFKTLEEHFFEKHRPEMKNINSFIDLSLSLVNRRKSRAGRALENHLESILESRHILYCRNGITEGKKRPDFLFPGIRSYRNLSFDEGCLTMLAVKQTCKDRWRQVLSEADRIEKKHLFTMEPCISRFQLKEMQESRICLVVPQAIRESFDPDFTPISFSSFMELVLERQKKCFPNHVFTRH